MSNGSNSGPKNICGIKYVMIKVIFNIIIDNFFLYFPNIRILTISYLISFQTFETIVKVRIYKKTQARACHISLRQQRVDGLGYSVLQLEQFLWVETTDYTDIKTNRLEVNVFQCV